MLKDKTKFKMIMFLGSFDKTRLPYAAIATSWYWAAGVNQFATLLKNLSIRRLIGDYSVSLSNTTCIFKNLHGCRIKFDPEYFCL